MRIRLLFLAKVVSFSAPRAHGRRSKNDFSDPSVRNRTMNKSLILAAALTLALTACGQQKPAEPAKSAAPAPAAAPAPVPAPAPMAAPAPAPMAAPAPAPAAAPAAEPPKDAAPKK
jgi:hypothetical protein